MIIYDIEIKNPIPDRKKPPEPAIEYCGGWHDFRGMGIACVGVYDYSTDRTCVFLEDNLDDFRKLIAARDLACGFNNVRFDNAVLEAHGIIIPRQKSYDLQREIFRGLGTLTKLDTDGFSQCHWGFSLNDVAAANCGLKKTGSGADAPINWQRGLHGNVINYCLADIAVTKRLIDKVIRWGCLFSPKNQNERIVVRRPAPEALSE